MKQENRELIVKIQVQIERLPFSRLYRGLQVELDKLNRNALTDLRDLLADVKRISQLNGARKNVRIDQPVTVRCEHCGDRVLVGLISKGGLCEECVEEEAELVDDIEQMARPVKRQKVAELELEEEIEDPCPECNAGEVYEGEADVSSCGRCEGTGTLS